MTVQEQQQLQAQQLMPGGQLSPQLSDIALQQQLASQYGLGAFPGTPPFTPHCNRHTAFLTFRLLETAQQCAHGPLCVCCLYQLRRCHGSSRGG